VVGDDAEVSVVTGVDASSRVEDFCGPSASSWEGREGEGKDEGRGMKDESDRGASMRLESSGMATGISSLALWA